MDIIAGGLAIAVPLIAADIEFYIAHIAARRFPFEAPVILINTAVRMLHIIARTIAGYGAVPHLGGSAANQAERALETSVSIYGSNLEAINGGRGGKCNFYSIG